MQALFALDHARDSRNATGGSFQHVGVMDSAVNVPSDGLSCQRTEWWTQLSTYEVMDSAVNVPSDGLSCQRTE